MADIITTTTANFHDTLIHFAWYITEYVCYLCIIAYTLYTFKIIPGPKFKHEEPATLGQTWSQTNSLLTTAVDIATKLKAAVEPENQPKEKTP